MKSKTIIFKDSQITGICKGNIVVEEGVTLVIKGITLGNIILQKNSMLEISGIHEGHLTIGENSKVLLTGILNGNVIDEGGILIKEKGSYFNGPKQQ